MPCINLNGNRCQCCMVCFNKPYLSNSLCSVLEYQEKVLGANQIQHFTQLTLIQCTNTKSFLGETTRLDTSTSIVRDFPSITSLSKVKGICDAVLPWQCSTSMVRQTETKVVASVFATTTEFRGSNLPRSRTCGPSPRRQACPCPGRACPAPPASPACLGAGNNTQIKLSDSSIQTTYCFVSFISMLGYINLNNEHRSTDNDGLGAFQYKYP